MPAKIDLWNRAVALVPADPISDVDENSLAARECRRFYPDVIANMLQGPHDWSFQNRRVALAVRTNDRENEWLYAYAVPADMATPIRVLPDFNGLGITLPIPLPGQPYGETWALFAASYEMPFIIESGILYTNAENATLEYGINDITGIVLPAMVYRAIATELAGWIALPIKKDRELRQQLLSEAEIHWSRAIADDRNRQPEPPSFYIPEALRARDGYC